MMCWNLQGQSQTITENDSLVCIPKSIAVKVLKTQDSVTTLLMQNALLTRLNTNLNSQISNLTSQLRQAKLQYKTATSMYLDAEAKVEILARQNEVSRKAAKKELFWKRFFQISTVAALTLAAIK